MLIYPQIYEYETHLNGSDDESKLVTTTLLEAITKLARPIYNKDCSFFTEYGWRIRLEVCSGHSDPDTFKYILDVGLSYDFGTLEEFKESCKASNSIISVAYCDNYLPEKHIITQEHGILKVYAMTAGNISEHARQRWITEIASTYVGIISDLDSHFLVVDAAAIHL